MTAKKRERLHLLATLYEYGPLSGVEVVHIANAECVHDDFDNLPELKPRGITSKLNGLSVAGLVKGEYPGGGRPMKWAITPKGHEVLAHGLAALDSAAATRKEHS